MSDTQQNGGVRYVVFTRVPEDRLDEWNRWHNTVHVPDVLATPHMRAARKYRVADWTLPEGWQPQYATIYELDSMDDLDAYLSGPAAALREDYDRRYGDGGQIARMVLVEEQRF